MDGKCFGVGMDKGESPVPPILRIVIILLINAQERVDNYDTETDPF